MGEPEKPFACTLPECGMTFTNEDHLHVHTKKHDMALQLGSEQKAAFVADQTPTPTRFIRNCEEVGLFQDLQNVNVNPFDEGFKRAMETKHGIMCLDGAVVTPASDDVLHTPQMVFPLSDPGDSTLYSTTNNHRNITISRSSSDESGSIKEYETTTISKLTNEVTTISRIVGKQDILDKITTTDDVSIVKHQEVGHNKNLVNETSVSYTNNVIKIHSNVEIRKDSNVVNIETSKPVTLISYKDSVTRDATSVVTKDVLLTDSNRLQIPQVNIPIMSQRSIDFVVDSLTAECENHIDQKDDRTIKVINNNNTFLKNQVKAVAPKANDKTVFNTSNKCKGNRKIGIKEELDNDYEVFLKLPNGKRVRMKAVEDRNTTEKHKVIEDVTKTKLKKVLAEKSDKKAGLDNSVLHRLPSLDGSQIVPNILPIAGGTFYPVTIVSPISVPVPKIPIVPLNLGKFNRPSETLKKNVKIKGKNNLNATEVPKNNLLKETVKKSMWDDNVSEHIILSDEDECVNTKLSTDKTTDLNLMKKLDSRSVDNPIKTIMESRSAASRRYRVRLKEKMLQQSKEITKLKLLNDRLLEDNYYLKEKINEHIRICSNADGLKNLQKDPLNGKS